MTCIMFNKKQHRSASVIQSVTASTDMLILKQRKFSSIQFVSFELQRELNWAKSESYQRQPRFSFMLFSLGKEHESCLCN